MAAAILTRSFREKLDNDRFHSPINDDRITGRFVSIAAAFFITASAINSTFHLIIDISAVKFILIKQIEAMDYKTNRSFCVVSEILSRSKKYRDPWDLESRQRKLVVVCSRIPWVTMSQLSPKNDYIPVRLVTFMPQGWHT